MNQLEKRFDEKVKNTKFTVLETIGMGTNPKLAIKAGMCLGYQMAIDDAENASNKPLHQTQKKNVFRKLWFQEWLMANKIYPYGFLCR